MASAQEYARWIVANKDKQGTPEFDTVARAYQIAKAQQPVTQEAAPSPLGSNMENFAAGAGKAVMDTYRGIKQLGARYEDLKTNLGLNPAGMPLLSPDADAAVNEAKRLDAPLMNTKAGLGGNLAGNAATFALAAPAATTVKGAAVVGGLAGAMQPVADGESRLMNTGLGAAAGAAGQYGANKIGEYFANRAVKQAALQAQNAPKDAAVAAAQDAGYVIPPTQANPSMLNRALEGLSGKIQTGQGASVKNQPVTNNLVKADLGIPQDVPLTKDLLQTVRNKAFQSGYEPVMGAGTVKTDDAYKAALDAIASKYEGAAKDFPGAASSAVTDFINGTKKTKLAGQYVGDEGDIIAKSMVPQRPKVRSLLDEIKKNGGLDVSEVGDLGIGGINKDYPGLLRKSGGNTGDDLVELLQQRGWISRKDVQFADENLVGGSHELARDMIRSALKREQVLHPADSAAATEYAGNMVDFGKYGARPATQADLPNTGGLRVPEFDAGNGIRMSQILRDEASAAFASGDKSLGKAKREAAKAIEDQIERHLASEGAGAEASDMLTNFRDARALMAKTHSAESALNDATGNISAAKLAVQLNKGKPLSGGLRTAAEFNQAFPKAAQTVENIGSMPGFSPLDAGASAMMAAAGHNYGAVGSILGRPLVRSVLLSQPYQNAFLQQSYGPSMAGQLLTSQPANALLRSSPVAAALTNRR